ncbi:MAG: DUF6580 family putative transport protein [Methanobacteriota archaeon]
MRSTRAWVAIGTLGGLVAALRVPFAFLPSVQPSTALVIAVGQGMGPAVGLGVGLIVPLASNLFLGHGPWTIFQAIAWGGIGLASGLLPKLPRSLLVGWGVVASFGFGLVLDSWVWWAFAEPRTLATLIPVLALGIPFNIAHAAATGGVLAVAGPRLTRILERGRVRVLGVPAARPMIVTSDR